MIPKKVCERKIPLELIFVVSFLFLFFDGNRSIYFTGINYRDRAIIDRKTPVLESLFTKVAGLQGCNFIKKRLQHRRFPVKFAHF